MENSKTFGNFASFSAAGEVELNKICLIRGGINTGWSEESLELRMFASANVSPFEKLPLDFSLIWVYHGIFEYDVHSNSILSFATYNRKRLGLSLGYNFRFTSFFGEASIMEATPMYLFNFKFVNNDDFRIGLKFGNFNEFNVRFITDYSYDFYAHVRVDENWQIMCNIDIYQSGAIALTETFYGVLLRFGARYTW